VFAFDRVQVMLPHVQNFTMALYIASCSPDIAYRLQLIDITSQSS